MAKEQANAKILDPEKWCDYLVRNPASFIEGQGHIPDLGIPFHDEIGREIMPGPKTCPVDRYESGRFGLREANSVSGNVFTITLVNRK